MTAPAPRDAGVGERVTDWPRFLEWLANMRGGRLLIQRCVPIGEQLPWYVLSGYDDAADSVAAEGGTLADALAELARFVTGGEAIPRPAYPEVTSAPEHLRHVLMDLDELIGDDPCYHGSIEERARNGIRMALDALASTAAIAGAGRPALDPALDDYENAHARRGFPPTAAPALVNGGPPTDALDDGR